MIRLPPRSTPLYSSAASDVYKRQLRFTSLNVGRGYSRCYTRYPRVSRPVHYPRERKSMKKVIVAAVLLGLLASAFVFAACGGNKVPAGSIASVGSASVTQEQFD